MPEVILASVLAVSMLTVSTVIFLRMQRPAFVDDPKLIASRVEEEDDKVPTYDVVIIGGGTAGCVLANHLSQDPNVRVLLPAMAVGEKAVSDMIKESLQSFCTLPVLFSGV